MRDQSKVRVRFAPSPTGPLHIGGVRTALFNYLFAKKWGGSLILRIEDTDSQRFVPGAEDYIRESLAWCGIHFDEGVGVGGPHAPYRQSERKDIYYKYAQQLVESGHAYYCFDTAEELTALREAAEAQGGAFTYNYAVRENLKTSLVLSEQEVQRRIAEEQHWVIRFKVPGNEVIQMQDLVRGDVRVHSQTLDDKVLWKKVDELPTYHLANIVDDHLMEISHVIRGEEWLPSLPLHVLLYRAFGWEESMPQFAHLSLLLKPDGKGKLSKRDGDRLGFPVFPLEWRSPENGEVSRGYREEGYFPEAFVNFLALLGWNPGTEQEIFSMDELIQAFSLERVIKSGARFNPDKNKWFNQQYLKHKSNEALTELFQPVLRAKGISAEDAYVAKVCGFIKERVHFVGEFWDWSAYFFVAPSVYDAKALQKFWKPETGAHLRQVIALLNACLPWDKVEAEQRVHDWILDQGLGMGAVMNAVRLSLVGASMGPSVFEIMDMIGVQESVRRIQQACERNG